MEILFLKIILAALVFWFVIESVRALFELLRILWHMLPFTGDMQGRKDDLDTTVAKAILAFMFIILIHWYSGRSWTEMMGTTINLIHFALIAGGMMMIFAPLAAIVLGVGGLVRGNPSWGQTHSRITRVVGFFTLFGCGGAGGMLIWATPRWLMANDLGWVIKWQPNPTFWGWLAEVKSGWHYMPPTPEGGWLNPITFILLGSLLVGPSILIEDYLSGNMTKRWANFLARRQAKAEAKAADKAAKARKAYENEVKAELAAITVEGDTLTPDQRRMGKVTPAQAAGRLSAAMAAYEAGLIPSTAKASTPAEKLEREITRLQGLVGTKDGNGSPITQRGMDTQIRRLRETLEVPATRGI